MNKQRKVTIWGDTSQVHFFAKYNYLQFRKLVATNFEIIQEIPDRFFQKDPDFVKLAWWRYHRLPRLAWSMYRRCPISIPKYLNLVRRSSYWKRMEQSDIIIVHGEGLTEKANNSAACLIAVSLMAKELGKECWLVNFSMFDAEPFVEMLRDFSYIACRDKFTHHHLTSLGIEAELSFDCCILGTHDPEYSQHDGSVSVIRGRHAPDDAIMDRLVNPVKYDVAWKWKTDDAVTLPSVTEYSRRINKSRFTASTSFHGNIMAFASGVPFLTFDDANKKYQALRHELLPSHGEQFVLSNLNWIGKDETRKRVYDHYMSLVEGVRKRAAKNCL